MQQRQDFFLTAFCLAVIQAHAASNTYNSTINHLSENATKAGKKKFSKRVLFGCDPDTNSFKHL
jgi:hypothetical protein